MQTRSFLTNLTVLILALAALSASAVNWTSLIDGAWTNDGNWDATNPDGPGALADFSTLDISTDITVTLDANRTVGTLTLGDTGAAPHNSWTIGPDATPGDILTLSVPSGKTAINVNQGTANAIAVPVSISNQLSITTAPGASLDISGNMTGSVILEKAGTGTLRLSGDNSGYSGQIYLGGNTNYENVGTIELANSTSLGTGMFINRSYGTTVRFNNVSGGQLNIPNNLDTYQGGGFTMYLGGDDMTFTGTWRNDQGAGFNIDSGITVTHAGTLTAASGFRVDGLGTLVLAADASAFGGTWTVDDGDNVSVNSRIGIATDNAFGNSSARVHMNNYANNTGQEYFAVDGPRTLANQWRFPAYNYSRNNVTFSGSHDLTLTGNIDSWWQADGSPHWIVTNTGLTTFAGAITANLSNDSKIIHKEGDGTLVMSGNNIVYTRPIQITAGVLRAQDGIGLPTASKLILAGGVLESNGAFARTLGTGNGQVQWSGSGGFSAYGGTLTVDLGTAGADNLTWGSGSFVSGTLAFGSTRSDSQVVMVDNINLGSLTRAIQVIDNPGTLTDNTALSGSLSGTGILDKTGDGTLLLNGDSSGFAGSVIVSNGTLGGTGTVGLGAGNNMTVNGNVAPGASIGTLTVGTAGNFNSVVFNTGSTLTIEIDAAGNSDLLNVIGTLDLSNIESLAITGDGFLPMHTYIFATYDNLIGQFDNIDTSGLAGWDGKDVVMTISENQMSFFVPEPTTAILMLAGLTGMLMRRRR